MSSHVRIRTLRFCTFDVEILCDAARLCNLSFDKKALTIGNIPIQNSEGMLYVSIEDNNTSLIKTFHRLNSEAAKLESEIRSLRLEQIEAERTEAKEKSEAYRARQLKKEQESIAFEKEKLELEKKSFVDAKKMAIEAKARSMGYSVKETVEGGKVKLMLVKRVYRC